MALTKCFGQNCPYAEQDELSQKPYQAYLKYKTFEINYVSDIINNYLTNMEITYKIDSYSTGLKIYNNLSKAIQRRIWFTERYIHPECTDSGHQNRINIMIFIRQEYEKLMSELIRDDNESINEEEEESMEDDIASQQVIIPLPITQNIFKKIVEKTKIDEFLELGLEYKNSQESYLRGYKFMGELAKRYLSEYLVDSKIESIPSNRLAAVLTIAYRANVLVMAAPKEEEIENKILYYIDNNVDWDALMEDFTIFEQRLALLKAVFYTNAISNIAGDTWVVEASKLRRNQDRYIDQQRWINFKNQIKQVLAPDHEQTTPFLWTEDSSKRMKLIKRETEIDKTKYSYLTNAIITQRILTDDSIKEIYDSFSESFIPWRMCVHHLLHKAPYLNIPYYVVQNHGKLGSFNVSEITLPSSVNLALDPLYQLTLRFEELDFPILSPLPDSKRFILNDKELSIDNPVLPRRVGEQLKLNENPFEFMNKEVVNNALLFSNLVYNLDCLSTQSSNISLFLMRTRAYITLTHYLIIREERDIFGRIGPFLLNIALKYLNSPLNQNFIEEDYGKFLLEYQVDKLDRPHIRKLVGNKDFLNRTPGGLYIYLNCYEFTDANIMTFPSRALTLATARLEEEVPIVEAYLLRENLSRVLPLSEVKLPQAPGVKKFFFSDSLFRRMNNER